MIKHHLEKFFKTDNIRKKVKKLNFKKCIYKKKIKT